MVAKAIQPILSGTGLAAKVCLGTSYLRCLTWSLATFFNHSSHTERGFTNSRQPLENFNNSLIIPVCAGAPVWFTHSRNTLLLARKGRDSMAAG